MRKIFQTVKFDQEFYSPPTMITTAEHYKDNIKATIDADNNAIQEWVRVRKKNATSRAQNNLWLRFRSTSPESESL